MARIGRIEIKITLLLKVGNVIVFRDGSEAEVLKITTDLNDKHHPFRIEFMQDGDEEYDWYTPEGLRNREGTSAQDIMAIKSVIKDD